MTLFASLVPDGGGALYVQLSRRIAAAIESGALRRARVCPPSGSWRS